MEAARSTEGFSRRITAADANNIVTVLDLKQNNSEYQIFEKDYIVKFQVALEDLKVTVGLSSLFPAPYPEITALMSEASKQAEIAKVQTNSQKISLGLYTAKGNGPWQYESEVILANQGSETHVPILVPFLSTNETLLVGGDFKLGVKIEAKWNQPLKVNDYLIVRGTYKQVVSFSKKKDDDLDALGDRISALENLLQIFGAPSLTLPGSNGLIPAPPANGGNFLLKGDRSWQNPNTFIASTNTGIYGSAGVPATAKGGWQGVFFEGAGNKNYLLQNPTTGDIGLYNTSAVRWNFYATDVQASIGLPLQINGSAVISKIVTLRAIISLPNIIAGGLLQVDLTMTGVNVGQFVSISPVINPVTNGFWTFYVHAQVLNPNVVSLFFKNDWTGALDLPDFWVRIFYIEFT
ncbi:MAG: hypothetical protein JGK38_23895 [Microcoleus sp. PH2017_15_JOR_U_A]|uniref:hypothetical protein n=1 Tax=unclassified Microcoleus TaxID=2642155 RepID=UPI001D67A2F5|nr:MULTISPECIES: hypothetical protein [unclassified Microcoleus]MCC3473302.1 hypothetical protein [Microcoleus sp. PH2017_13_LAR_U_A]MCC3486532.1 hypothetical protein [Microcoleus sp. PH2017_14_LAR_D_A]MCC3499600.1 hypothetical protein [Microcoleus sp. PH2017_15_JOR_U_A]MCC3600171.1 hypothetical protein [Microcoleus sp. PH2017_26_ELK_O_A]MCC3623174.1 hypothetical protein [Microcoleus sp. PH2017_36_ELK_O_B]